MRSPRTTLLDRGRGAKPQTVEQRIERRLEVLREWLRNGVPVGRSIPKNLKAVRIWEESELRIQPIASPNEFTTTHRLHGPLIRDIAGILTELKKRYKQPARAQPKASTSVEKFDRKAFERQLEAVVSQWHSERDQRLSQERRADAAEARNVLLLEDSAKKDVLIADLRRQVAVHKGLRVVK